jgi:signal transduction histidine kinase
VRQQGTVTLRIKNISNEPLNISADELMQRFVRGEKSRSSEGNGLGLYIAERLTTLMGGTLTLTIDGDLFEASITLPTPLAAT